MPNKSLYLIDGHAQMYRAYYAPFGALTSPSGEPTRATHVFMQMVLNILRKNKPDYLAMVMDAGDADVFRMEIEPTYKGNRQAPPEDLGPQIDRIVQILTAMRVPIMSMRGFEADDIIATLCERFCRDPLDIYLVSKDKDLDQLLRDCVRMFDPGKDRVIDGAALIAEKGYGPDLAVEAQMLIGDSTDNIIGVPGVGPKKAAQLLGQYGSVSGIIANADKLTPKLRENVLAFVPRMETVRQLVTLRRDVPIDFDLETADVKRFDRAAVRPIFRALGFTRLVDQLGLKDQPESEEEAQQSAPALDVPDPEGRPAVPPGETGQRGLFDDEQVERPVRGKYELVDTPDALAQLAAKLNHVQAFAFDTETTGLCPAACNLVGISISFEAGRGYYIPLAGVGRTLSTDDVVRQLGPVFANRDIRKRGQNMKFDIGVLKWSGMPVSGVDFDSMIASFVLDSARRSHGLDQLSMEFLKYRPIPTDELIGRGKSQTTFDKLPTDRVCEYAVEDADISWRLCDVLEQKMTDPELKKLFRDVEMPLVEVLADMEHRGVAIDSDMLGRISNDMADKLKHLRDQIHEQVGRPFNIDSTKQLAEVLFDERKLRVIKSTRTGRSTDADVLEQLAAESNDPVPKLVVEYRELAKLKGTYVDALPEMVSARTGRIHPSFHQTGAVTGRLSCSDPNLQNIPIRTDVGAQIRRAFVPGGPDMLLLKADYSQIELRILAHFSGDEALAEAFREDRDIHAFVAAQIDGVPLDAVTKQQRSRAKTVNFGIVYGQSAFGLARQTGMSLSAAKIFIEKYFQRYPRIRDFLDSCIAHARKHGYVKTILGRRRAITDIHSRNQTARTAAERFAVNTVVQGTAADLIKLAMIRIDQRVRREGRPARMLLQVHDELVFEVPKSAVKAEAAMIAEEMSSAIPLRVPVKVDVGAGANWLDMEPVA